METNHPWIQRHAKLFEAGEYPDKGITISPDDLKRLELNFTQKVPLLIEHATSPLELGFLTEVQAKRCELFGTVELSPEANALIESNNAKSLSIGLSTDLQTIEEVSLVNEPRVTSAKIFSGRLVIEDDWKAKFLALKEQSRTKEVKGKVAKWIESGKLFPAQAEFAAAILASEGKVTFGEATTEVAALLERLIENQPATLLFTESVPNPERTHDFTSDESDFYQKYFPSLELDQIAQRK